MEKKLTRIYSAEVKLNESDDNYTKQLILENNSGVLFIDSDFFVLSFQFGEVLYPIIKNKVYVGQAYL